MLVRALGFLRLNLTCPLDTRAIVYKALFGPRFRVCKYCFDSLSDRSSDERCEGVGKTVCGLLYSQSRVAVVGSQLFRAAENTETGFSNLISIAFITAWQTFVTRHAKRYELGGRRHFEKIRLKVNVASRKNSTPKRVIKRKLTYYKTGSKAFFMLRFSATRLSNICTILNVPF